MSKAVAGRALSIRPSQSSSSPLHCSCPGGCASGGNDRSHTVLAWLTLSQTILPKSLHCPSPMSLQGFPRSVNHSSILPSQLPSRPSHLVSVKRTKPCTTSTSGGYSHDQPWSPLHLTTV